MSAKRLCAMLILVTALGLSGCSGRTTGATTFNASNNTIRLNAIGSCDTTCTAFMRFRVAGASAWSNTSSFSVGKVNNAPWSRTVTVSPGARYEYQACGKEAAQSQATCVGPDGKSGTTEPFVAGALQARTGNAPYAFTDRDAQVTGELESTRGGRVSYWSEYGKTTAYGSSTSVSNPTLSANVRWTVYESFSGLQPSTTYHYRLCASDRTPAGPGQPGAVCGADRTFTTKMPATTVTCGQVITRSTYVANDLSCTGDGLAIGAANITLDLGGHTISGDGEAPDCGPSGGEYDTGLINTAGHDRVTVMDGRFEQFETGARLHGASDNVLANIGMARVSIGGVCVGIYLEDSDRTQIHNPSVEGASIRLIGVQSSDGVVIDNGYLTNSSHVGIAVWNSAGARIEGNQVSNVRDFSIELIGASSGRVLRNTVAGQRGDGIVLAVGSNDNVVDANTVSGTHDDIETEDPGQFAGIEVVDASARNKVTNNQVSNNESPGIAIGLPLTGSTASNANTVSGNTVRTSADGIIVGSLATNTTVSQNTTSDNADDGIDADSASTTITSNTARTNGDLGIEAIAGVTDGGGNRASGNRNATRQCLNVTCSP